MELEDGSEVKGFLVEAALDDAALVEHHDVVKRAIALSWCATAMAGTE